MFPSVRRICLTLLTLCCGVSGFSATIQSAAGGGNWNVGASWVGNIVPVAGDDVFIVAGSTINLTSSQPCTNLRIEGILNLSNNGFTVSVSGNLTFAGIGSTTANNATRSINVTGNLLSETGANGAISGINLTINGTTNLQGRILFNNATGSKTLVGQVTIDNGGAMDFSAAATIILTSGGLVMNGVSSLGGTSAATGTLVGVNDFTVNAGATATIGRLAMAIIGLAKFDGVATFSNVNGAKSFVGGGQINAGGAIEFTAAAALSFANSITMNGNSSIGGASVSTGSINGVSTFTISAGATATIGRVDLTVVGASTVTGSMTFNNATGTKTLSGDVTVGPAGAIAFSAAATVGMGANLITNPGAILGNTITTGTINLVGNFNVLTGGSTFVNGLNLNALGNVTVPGTAVLDLATGTSTIALQGNWNVTSSAGNPFVEGIGRVTFNGTAGTQSITTTEAGGEHFYDLTVNNTSVANPGVSTVVSLSIAHSLTYTAGILDLVGRSLTITGNGTSSTDTYTAGAIITSVPGSLYTVTDPSTNKTINFNGTTFGDAVNGIPTTVTSASSFFNGSDFFGNASFTKTGAALNDCNGGSEFHGPVSFTTTVAADRWRMGNTNPDIFHDATFTHNGSSNFIIARQSLGNEFFGTTTLSSSTAGGLYIGRSNTAANGSATFHGPAVINVTLTGSVFFAESDVTRQNDDTFESTILINATASSTGNVTFGSTGFGSTTLTPTAQFIPGSILGACTISLIRLTQNGNLPQSITAAGTSIISCGGTDFATFNANVTFTAPQVQLRLSTFNGITNSFTQNGGTANGTFGGNTFAAGSSNTFTNQGTGAWRLGSTAADDFNGAVTFLQAGSGALQPSYTANSTYAGNISTVGSGTAITFGSNGGRVTLDGAAAKNLNGDLARPPVIAQLTMNGSGALTLNVPLTITTDINFTDGILFTSAANLLTLNAGSAVSGTPSNTTHVDGPVRKIGNTAFSFPVGDNNIYRAIAISAPGNVAHHFTAQYFKATQAFGNATTYDPTFVTVSSCEYWVLDRTNGASNVSVTLSWNSPDCTGPYITDITTLRVTRWNLTNWVTQGNGGTTGNATTGTIVSAGVVTSFSPFTIASVSPANPLPLVLTSFTAKAEEHGVSLQWRTASELNNDFFTVERSLDGFEFRELSTIKGSGTSNQFHDYTYLDENPGEGKVYYRLKQTDFDGRSTLSHVVSVDLSSDRDFVVYPNPVRETLKTNHKDSAVIYDILYRPVLRTSDASQIDIAALPEGNYFIQNGKGQVQRFIKVN